MCIRDRARPITHLTLRAEISVFARTRHRLKSTTGRTTISGHRIAVITLFGTRDFTVSAYGELIRHIGARKRKPRRRVRDLGRARNQQSFHFGGSPGGILGKKQGRKTGRIGGGRGRAPEIIRAPCPETRRAGSPIRRDQVEVRRTVRVTDPGVRTRRGIRAVPPCLLYTSPSPRDRTRSRMPSSA